MSAGPTGAAGPGGGRPALWDRITGRASGAAAPLPPLPKGAGPLVWMRLGPEEPRDGGAPAQLAGVLRAMRPGLRLIVTHPEAPPPPDPDQGAMPRVVPGTLGPTLPDPGHAPEAVRAFIDHAAPAVLLLLGTDLPEVLLAEADRLHLPVVLAGANLGRGEAMRRGWRWQRGRPHPGLGRVQRVMIPDLGARDAAIRLGAPPDRVEVVGAMAETPRPLGCAEAERAALALALRGRQSWFAVDVPEAEEDAVLDAHRLLLGHSHRALLILAPADVGRCEALRARLETEDLDGAIRSQIDEPDADLQVLLADDPGEFGLWYRLAPVSYLGGTLSGGFDRPSATRHPFEAAALGSAILHGPRHRHDHASAWADLHAAQATHEVRQLHQLGPALDTLMAPERAAELAARAWAVSTAGAAVAQRVAGAVIGLLD